MYDLIIELPVADYAKPLGMSFTCLSMHVTVCVVVINHIEWFVNYFNDLSRDVQAELNPHRLFVPQINNNYGRCSLYYRGTALWNALPPSLHDTATFTDFQNSSLRIF